MPEYLPTAPPGALLRGSNKMSKSFMTACREFFGLLPNQTPIAFGKEIQALTQADRTEIAAGLVANGIDLDMATVEKK